MKKKSRNLVDRGSKNYPSFLFSKPNLYKMIEVIDNVIYLPERGDLPFDPNELRNDLARMWVQNAIELVRSVDTLSNVVIEFSGRVSESIGTKFSHKIIAENESDFNKINEAMAGMKAND